MDNDFHADPSEKDCWEDKNVTVHEIKVDVVEITEDDGIPRADIRPKKDGPAWKNIEDSEPSVPAPAAKSTYRAKGLVSNKKAPVNNALNFPGISETVSENPQEDGKKKEDYVEQKSNNRFEGLNDEENTAKDLQEEEKKPAEPKKKGKKSKKDKWKKIEANIKVGTTVKELESNIFEAEVVKKPDFHEEKPKHESRSFAKPSDGPITRNYDNKLADFKPSDTKPNEGRSRDFKSFGKPSEGGFVRNYDIKPKTEGLSTEKEGGFVRNYDIKPKTEGLSSEKGFVRNYETKPNFSSEKPAEESKTIG